MINHGLQEMLTIIKEQKDEISTLKADYQKLWDAFKAQREEVHMLHGQLAAEERKHAKR